MKNILASVLLLTTALTAQWRPYTANEIRTIRAYGNAVHQQGLYNAARPCRPVMRPARPVCRPISPVFRQPIIVQPPVYTPRFNCRPRFNGWVYPTCQGIGGVIGYQGRWGGITIGF